MVTTDGLASLLGVSARTVTELGRRGIIPRAPRRGRWPIPAAVQAYCEHLREVAAGRAGGGANEGLDLVTERALLARAQRAEVELRTAAKRGELVDAAAVRERYAALVVTARGRLLGVPSKAKGRLSHLSIDDIETLEELIHEALAELAEGGRTDGN
ncbi:hypothetical protein D9M70_370290 [compost metagenome]